MPPAAKPIPLSDLLKLSLSLAGSSAESAKHIGEVRYADVMKGLTSYYGDLFPLWVFHQSTGTHQSRWRAV